MGWTSFNIHKTQKSADVIIRELSQDSHGGARSSWEVIAHSMRGRVFYGIMRRTHYAADRTPAGFDVYGIVVLTERKREFPASDYVEFYYKEMDESLGPFYYDMPARMLDLLDELAPNPTGQAKGWRDACREKQRAERDRRRQKTTYKPGDRVLYAGNVYTLDAPAGPRRGWYVTRANGAGARMPAGILAAAVPAKGAADA